jgi:choline/glycine/proline betaine transport protein
MKITFFHWGIHAWAVYSILAVTLAYFCYRKSLPLLPRSSEVLGFLKGDVKEAMHDLSKAMQGRELNADFVLGDDNAKLVVKKNEVEDFVYKVVMRKFNVPDYAAEEEQEAYRRAEVFLLSGGQDYDIFGYSKEQIIADIVTQYEKHFHYLHQGNSEIYN